MFEAADIFGREVLGQALLPESCCLRGRDRHLMEGCGTLLYVEGI